MNFFVSCLAFFMCSIFIGLKAETPIKYYGICDASGGVALNNEHFVVANDEDNILRIYHRDGQPRSVAEFDLNDFLMTAIDRKYTEVDLEGATLCGDMIFWISSHGRNKNGKLRSNRYRFFALQWSNGKFKPVGKPYQNLLADLMQTDFADKTGLTYAYQPQRKRTKALAPKRTGLNIEGICEAADGNGLLIGFRNPRPQGYALVVPLLNPVAIVMNGKPAQFGEPILFDFHGLGIRDMVWSSRHQAHLIIAGAHDGTDIFEFYRWSGKRGDTPTIVKDSAYFQKLSLNPESIILWPDGVIQILSDDGGVKQTTGAGAPCDCKELERNSDKKFRSIQFEF